jgi:hypothetical protein
MRSIIKKLLYRGMIGALLLSLLLSAMTPMVKAEEEGNGSVKVSAKRFMTDEIRAEMPSL